MLGKNPDNTWTIDIILDHNISDLAYTIKVIDISGNIRNGTLTNVTVYDNDPPEIHSLQSIPPYQNVGGYVNITWDIKDNIQINMSYLNITGPGNFNPLNISINQTFNYYNMSYSLTRFHF